MYNFVGIEIDKLNKIFYHFKLEEISLTKKIV